MGAPVERIHTATIPPGLAAGDPFLIREVRADGKTVAMSLTVPADKRGGETIRVRSQGPAPVALVAQHAPTAEHGPIAEDLDDDLDDDFGEQTQSDARAAAPAAASHDSAPLVNTTAPTRTRGDAPPMTAAPGFTSATPGPLGSGVPGPSAAFGTPYARAQPTGALPTAAEVDAARAAASQLVVDSAAQKLRARQAALEVQVAREAEAARVTAASRLAMQHSMASEQRSVFAISPAVEREVAQRVAAAEAHIADQARRREALLGASLSVNEWVRQQKNQPQQQTQTQPQTQTQTQQQTQQQQQQQTQPQQEAQLQLLPQPLQQYPMRSAPGSLRDSAPGSLKACEDARSRREHEQPQQQPQQQPWQQ